MVYSFWRWLNFNVSSEEFKNILEEADIYIKLNRVSKGVRTGTLKYIEICIVCTARVLKR
ncbi:MAG TPA: hypothetical protein DG753_05725 [Clostridium sp.]|nr:hypothetical protein [Clostridium sp.]